MWQLSEQAHARSEQGSERTVCINAFRGAFYRAVQCCAVRCSEVHWPCLQLLRAGSTHAICAAAGFCRACGCRASGQGSRRVAEAAIAARKSPLGAHLARCRGRRRRDVEASRHFFNREFPVRECESVDLPLLKKLCEAPHFFPLHFYTLTHATE